MQFQYRGLNRWSGPWDNPNIFGLLMGTGVVLAAGMLVASCRLKVAGFAAWRRWVWRGFILGCMACCAVGLLKSYSRGAWLGTVCGLAVLAFQVFRLLVACDNGRPLTPSLSPSDGERVPGGRVRGIHSRGSCLSRLVSGLFNHRVSLAILIASLLVICFWQFRYTEFHPVRRAFSVGNKNDFSWRNRVAAWEGALAMMADKPLVGFGWNKPERIYDQYYRRPKVSEGMAIQLNHYFILGMSLGLPALLCFAAYIGLSLTQGRARHSVRAVTGAHDDGAQGTDAPHPQTSSAPPSSDLCRLTSVGHSAAVVLLIGLWFDGGLFNLATASLFWVLLELGRGTALPACRGKGDEAAQVSRGLRISRFAVALVFTLLLTSLFWARARDPLEREWMSLKTLNGQPFNAVVVMPDRGGPFSAVVWCHGADGSLDGDGEMLRQFASLGMAAVGLEYDKTNRAGFDAQFAAVLEEVEKKSWAAKAQQTRSAERPSSAVDLLRRTGGVRNEQREQAGSEGGEHSTLNIQHSTSNEGREAEHRTSNIEPRTSNGAPISESAANRKSQIVNRKSNQPTPDPSQEGNLQRATFNFQPATRIAWAGHSLGAQRQLSFLARHPERQPVALVRLNGGMVEEFRGKAESGNSEIGKGEHSTLNVQLPTRRNPRPGPTTRGTWNLQPSTCNLQPAKNPPLTPPWRGTHNRPPRLQLSTFNLQLHCASGLRTARMMRCFRRSDARTVAESLRAAGAEVQLDVFPGRGHGFGEDQPLLVRGAAEFCARELGATAVVPDNVRPSLWACWLPVGMLGLGFGVWRLGRGLRGVGKTGRSSRGLRWTASAALVAAVAVSGAHLVLPQLPASPETARLARAWCVQPGLRADFDWLIQQPCAKGCRLRDLLEHLNLATIQRGQFAASLSDSEWREHVLSPWIERGGVDIAWRRELWEAFAPRVRRETDVEQAAAQVARQLRLRVRRIAEDSGEDIRQNWQAGQTSENAMRSLQVAAFRAVGLAARLVNKDSVEVLVSGEWRAPPKPFPVPRTGGEQ